MILCLRFFWFSPLRVHDSNKFINKIWLLYVTLHSLTYILWIPKDNLLVLKIIGAIHLGCVSVIYSFCFTTIGLCYYQFFNKDNYTIFCKMIPFLQIIIISVFGYFFGNLQTNVFNWYRVNNKFVLFQIGVIYLMNNVFYYYYQHKILKERRQMETEE